MATDIAVGRTTRMRIVGFQAEHTSDGQESIRSVSLQHPDGGPKITLDPKFFPQFDMKTTGQFPTILGVEFDIEITPVE